MPTAEPSTPRDFDAPPAPRLFKRQVAEQAPVTPRSVALFRFGEECNNHCPMCSNTGRAALRSRATGELLRRADFLHGLGFRRAMVTGGEPTIHPGFWTIVERLAAHGMVWDANTHGRSFAAPGFATRAAATGLRRAIVSLHSFDPPTSAAIFGIAEPGHFETVAGVEHLLDAGVGVMLNCVLTRLNLDQLEDYLGEGCARWGRRVAFKFVFPSTGGKGGRWAAIATLRYDEVRAPLARLQRRAAELQARLFFESLPRCVLGDPTARNMGRSAFGESHYLDDAGGDRVYAMRHIEAELSAFGEACHACAALRHCAGLAYAYASRHGVGELTPFSASPEPRR